MKENFSDKKDCRVTVLIVAGGNDFGRAALDTRVARAMWPVLGEPALDKLTASLYRQGFDDIAVCSDGLDLSLNHKLRKRENNGFRLIENDLPTGTAGALRDAADGTESELFVVIPANVMRAPSAGRLIKEHIQSGSQVSVVFNPPAAGQNGTAAPQTADIFIFDRSVLEYIRPEGYFDIKENLIPNLLAEGCTAAALELNSPLYQFRNSRDYLHKLSVFLENTTPPDGFTLRSDNRMQKLYCGKNVLIEPSAKIYGTVVIADNARIESGAVVIGPAAIGRGASIGPHSTVINSVLWDNARVSADSRVQRCILDYNAVIKPEKAVTDTAVVYREQGIIERIADKMSTGFNKLKDKRTAKADKTSAKAKLAHSAKAASAKNEPSAAGWAALGIMAAAFLWSYWPNLMRLWDLWQRSDEYSVGLMVPFLAMYVAWSRRDKLLAVPFKPCLAGMLLFIAAQGLRFFGLFFMYSSAERISIVLSIAALVLFLGGWKLLLKVSTVLLFLCLMLPWPNRIETAITIPLQRWATASAVFSLELLGYGVNRAGNVINIGDTSVAIAEACNGLRMITAFFVIGALIALIVNKTWLEKLIIVASCLPIALMCNTVRLTITAIAFTFLDGEKWAQLFHDFGGYAMMPLALAMVVGELWLITRLTTPPDEAGPPESVVFVRQKS